MRYAVFVPVGPDPQELRRLEAVTESLQAHTGSPDTLVLVDDGPPGRRLEERLACRPRETVTLRSPLAGTPALPNDRMTAATLTFLRWLADTSHGYALKLDTDALVIGDFRPALEAAFNDPTLGLCGACERNVAGGPLRDISLWRRQLLLACSPLQIRTGAGGRRIALALRGQGAAQRRFLTRAIRSARQHGYRLGEHCLGGSYALAGTAARALSASGALTDSTVTRGTGLSEDVTLALLVRSAGFTLRSLVGCGEPFALRHRGLLATPEELLASGHTVIHSVKASDPERERQLIESFTQLREP